MDYFSELYMIGENSEFEPRPEVKEAYVVFHDWVGKATDDAGRHRRALAIHHTSGFYLAQTAFLAENPGELTDDIDANSHVISLWRTGAAARVRKTDVKSSGDEDEVSEEEPDKIIGGDDGTEGRQLRPRTQQQPETPTKANPVIREPKHTIHTPMTPNSTQSIRDVIEVLRSSGNVKLDKIAFGKRVSGRQPLELLDAAYSPETLWDNAQALSTMRGIVSRHGQVLDHTRSRKMEGEPEIFYKVVKGYMSYHANLHMQSVSKMIEYVLAAQAGEAFIQAEDHFVHRKGEPYAWVKERMKRVRGHGKELGTRTGKTGKDSATRTRKTYFMDYMIVRLAGDTENASAMAVSRKQVMNAFGFFKNCYRIAQQLGGVGFLTLVGQVNWAKTMISGFNETQWEYALQQMLLYPEFAALNMAANDAFGYDLMSGQTPPSILNMEHRDKDELREMSTADALAPVNSKRADLVQQLDSGNITVEDAMDEGM